MTERQPLSILLVEDNEFDVRRIERAFSKLQIDLALHHARDGQEALDFLETKEIRLPMAILLDINMPRMNGLEFLERLRQDEQHARVPVHIFTTSEYYRDIEAAYSLGISGYYVKPTTAAEMIEITRSLMFLAQLCRYSMPENVAAL